MEIGCIWEHNGDDSLLYCREYPGAYTRAGTKDEALAKMPQELNAWFSWLGERPKTPPRPQIVQEKVSSLDICDADSDVLFDAERAPLTLAEYAALKRLALRSAQDFLRLYRAVPNPDASCLARRATFYGEAPRTARQMYEHTKNVNNYYFGEIGVRADNEGTILECRRRGFETLEQAPDFLANAVYEGSYQELWSLRKVLRRFVWHDRIHAKAMYRMALRTFGAGSVPDVFCFGAAAARGPAKGQNGPRTPQEEKE